jgi:hypothetical protein
MKTRQSFPLRSIRRLWLPAGLLLALAGGTAAAAAPAQPAGQAPAVAGQAQATFKWHTIKLLGGWESASTPSLPTGIPAWSLHDGVVYLRGAIMQPANSESIFGYLPKWASPPQDLYIQIYNAHEASGILYIGTNGEMWAYGGYATTFSSLSGISFATSAIKSHKLTLENGWTSDQSVYSTGDPAYAVSNGVVYLSGSLAAGKTSWSAFVLPKAARPASELIISEYTFAGSTGWLRIMPSGKVQVFGTEAPEYTSLANISYPVASTKWHAFKLVDGWKSGAARFHTAAPTYAAVNGVVYLNGSMYQPSPTNGLWTRLPAATKPADVLEIEVGTANDSVGSIGLASGLGLAASAPASNAEAFTSLAGIAYSTGE